MRSPHEIKEVIESRLKNYLSRDRTGVRHALMQLFLRLKSLTIAEIFEVLATNILYQAITQLPRWWASSHQGLAFSM